MSGSFSTSEAAPMTDAAAHALALIAGSALAGGLGAALSSRDGLAPRAGRIALRVVAVAAAAPFNLAMFGGGVTLSSVIQALLAGAGLWSATGALLAADARKCVQWSMAAAIAGAALLTARGAVVPAAALAATQLGLLFVLSRRTLAAPPREISPSETVASCLAAGLFLAAILVAGPIGKPATPTGAPTAATPPPGAVVQSLLGRYALPTLGLSVLVFAAVSIAGGWQTADEQESNEESPL